MSTTFFKKIGSFITVAMLATVGQHAFAASTETPSGTTVANTVTVNYSVSSVAQPAQTATRNFLVDNKVNLVVTGTGVSTVANATDAVLTYTVTNTGNTTQGYSLAVEAGSPDTFDMNSVRIYVEDGTTPGFQLAEDTLYTSGSGTNAFNLTQTAGTDSQTVYVVANVPPNGGGTAPVNGATAAYNLKATTLNNATNVVTVANTGSADTFNAVDVVFADDNGGSAGPFTGDTVNNGVDSAQAVYTISSSELTVTKTSAVVSDPVNGAVNPKAIPGATMRYTITIANAATASAAASSVVMSDAIPSNTTYVSTGTGSITLDGTPKTDAADADEAAFATNTVTVTIPSIPINTTRTITFDVTIN
jgi:uncharacterized repeat protein (TIGR01451 family)